MTTPTGPDPARLSASTDQPETVEEMAARTGWPVEFLNMRVSFDPNRTTVSAPQQPPAIDSPLIAVHDATADQTQQPPAQERECAVCLGHGIDCPGDPGCQRPTPPSEPVSLPRQQRDTVQQAGDDNAGEVDRMAAVLEWHLPDRAHDSGCALRCGYDGDDLAEHLAAALAAALAASPGVQGGDGEAPTSSEPRSDLTSAPGMSSGLDAGGEARERLAQWLWQHDGMKPEQWSQAREATREDWRREADLALRAAGGAR